MSNITLRVNGRVHTVDVEPRRRCSTSFATTSACRAHGSGADSASAVACTVVINGTAVRSCITPTSSVRGEITTLEGLAKTASSTRSSRRGSTSRSPSAASARRQIMTAKALLDKNPHPTDEQIPPGHGGTLCRCMTYFRIQTAIKRVAGRTV